VGPLIQALDKYLKNLDAVVPRKVFELLDIERAGGRSSDIINLTSVESKEKTGVLLQREREYGSHRRNKR
jgi:hypothetical protein